MKPMVCFFSYMIWYLLHLRLLVCLKSLIQLFSRSCVLLLFIINLEGEDGSVTRPSSANKDLDLEAGQIDPYTETWTGVLQDIAHKCGTKV